MPEAVKVVMENISSRPESIREISSRLNMSWRTVWKALEVIKSIQDELDDYEVVVEKVGKTFIVRKEPRTLMRLPTEERRRFVRETFFPEPREMELAILELFKRDATSPEKAVRL